MRILLSGAGITSNTLAYLLSRTPKGTPAGPGSAKAGVRGKHHHHHEITIIERAPFLRDTGLQIDLRGPGVEVLRRMGLSETLRRKTIREEGIRVVDGMGRRRAWFPVSRPREGDGRGKKKTSLTTEWEVMRGDLCRLLFDATVSHTATTGGGGDGGTIQRQGQGVMYRFGMTISDLHEREDGVDVRFSNGEREKFDLVIGGDGQGSKVRELMVRAANDRSRLEQQVLGFPSSSSSSSSSSSIRLGQDQGKGLAGVDANAHAYAQGEDKGEDPFKPLGVYAGLFTTSWPLEPSSTSTSTSNNPDPQSQSQALIGTAYLAPGKRAIFTRRHRPDRIQVYLFCRSDSPAFATLRRGHLDPAEEKALMMRHFRDAGWEADRLMKALETAEDFYCERIGFVRMGGWSSLTFPSSDSSSCSSSSSGQGEGSASTSPGDAGDGDGTGYTGGRIVLVGDAAYAPSVTTGMGTTAGMVGAYVLAGEIGKHCTSAASANPNSNSETGSHPQSQTDPEFSREGIQTAVREYERKLRPFIAYIQKDLSEGSSAWDSLPETKFGVGLWNVLLGVSSWLRVDSFGKWVRDDKGAGWVLPDYERD